MIGTFKGFRIHEIDGKIVARMEPLTIDDLAPGEVVVRVQYSDINYKDALAATGAGRILRKYPLVGGIDLAGVVERVLGRVPLVIGNPEQQVGKIGWCTGAAQNALADAITAGAHASRQVHAQ